MAMLPPADRTRLAAQAPGAMRERALLPRRVVHANGAGGEIAGGDAKDASDGRQRGDLSVWISVGSALTRVIRNLRHQRIS